MRVDAFDFDLPEELIALRPARPRDSARLLEIKHGALAHHLVSDLPNLLRPGDICVFNDTSVIHAQLSGRRAARESRHDNIDVVEPKIDVTLHKRHGADHWRAFAKPGRKLALGDVIKFAPGFEAELVGKQSDGDLLLRFNESGAALDALIAKHGVMPLPPYIASRRAVDESDESNYQTIYAAHSGSVAAPTAGLHFTSQLLGALEARGILQAWLTLHVGAGTFLPVKSEDTSGHRMHAEWGEISPDAADKINAARLRGGRIVSIGTTSLRLMESATGQDGRILPFAGETSIFITPGYRFRAADLLFTNFHLPRSTLFMLVSAFAGLDVMKRAYATAIAERYRFYSYGDACLIYRGAS
ncbi:MAG TPA: tRNA preQ1(34) S-adenosylmethionine ribosyltransferase-isomerase QueA [Alphaproteobacteria bacterium]|nr:tRNA preQ1(34) S-adenosylmethionine ribosyltransferase-isomerase QueA [Alphaproteobacteria bacterium]